MTSVITCYGELYDTQCILGLHSRSSSEGSGDHIASLVHVLMIVVAFSVRRTIARWAREGDLSIFQGRRNISIDNNILWMGWWFTFNYKGENEQ